MLRAIACNYVSLSLRLIEICQKNYTDERCRVERSVKDAVRLSYLCFFIAEIMYQEAVLVTEF